MHCRVPVARRVRRLPSPRTPLLLVGAIVSHTAIAVTTGPVAANTAAYPPSCLAAPLVDVPSSLSYRQPTKLAAVDRDTLEFAGFETVDFTFWRVACEAGRSALLVRIARAQDANAAHAVQFPFAYGLAARQAGRTGTLRLAQEPNTGTASLPPGALIDSAITLVVENLPQDADFPGFIVPSALPAGVHGAAFDFNRALDVVIPDAQTAGIDPPPTAIVLSIPAYDERAYPEASAPMPISGYNGGNYDDPAHAGEGIIVEIGNRPAGAGEPSRYVSLAWFTYDTEHRPFWLFGVAPFVPGVRAIAVPIASFRDGGFAGDFGASSTPVPWGSVSLSFPDCESMHFEYAARAGLQPPLPAGAGERNWRRVTQANGLACR
jgi:hypothetical protein